MKRLVLILALSLAGITGVTVRPATVPASPADLSGPGKFLVCAGGEAGSGFDTSVVLAAGAPGQGRVSLLGAGGTSDQLTVDDTGAGLFDLSAIAELGREPALVETPVAEAAAVTLTRSGPSLRATGCTGTPDEMVVLAGGSTRTGEELTMMLANPFATPARVRVRPSSELGLDTSPSLDVVTVPAGGFVDVNLTRLLPSRASLVLRLVAEEGRVVAAGRQTGGEDVAGWEAIPGGVDWYLPIPEVLEGARLVIANAALGQVDVRIDLLGDGGLEEAVVEAQIDAGAHLDFPLVDLVDGPAGLRVASSDLVVPVLVVEQGEVRAIGNGSRLGTRWLVPGAGALEAETGLWVLNPLDEPVQILVTPLGGQLSPRQIDLPALSVVAIEDLPANSVGLQIDAEAAVAVAWTASTEAAMSYQSGVPLDG